MRSCRGRFRNCVKIKSETAGHFTGVVFPGACTGTVRGVFTGRPGQLPRHIRPEGGQFYMERREVKGGGRGRRKGREEVRSEVKKEGRYKKGPHKATDSL